VTGWQAGAVQIELLGPLRVLDDRGAEIAVPGARLRRLLAELALRGGRPVSTGLLEDVLWDDGGPTGPGALQSLVSRLRRTLGTTVEITAGPAGYALPGVAVDVPAFERAAVTGRNRLRAGDPAGAATDLRDALARWRGPLAEIAGGADAGRLEESRLDALGDLAEARLLTGDTTGLVAELGELVAAHPLRERFAALRIRALCAVGRPAEALAAYEETRALLAEELGVDPSPQLREAHLQALAEPPSAAAPPNRPTRSLTSFVGRDADLDRLTGLLGSANCVTVVGPGGAGKTRLAFEAAQRIGRSWTVHEVQLAPVAEGDDVQGAVVTAVGVGEVAMENRTIPHATLEPLQRLRSALSSERTGRPVLLLLDNCEHVLDATAVLVEDLLRHCPGLTVLTTSREALGAEGEVLHPLGPLRVPTADATLEQARASAAVTMFADRAAAVDPGFSVTTGNRGLVVDLVRRLDGLPLALELAAARLRTMTLADLDARLSDRFRVLAGGRRTAVARHQTLRAVVDWSWDLLGEEEQALLQRLAVFAAPVTLDAAAAVGHDLGDEVEIADLLGSLTEKSLLQLQPGPPARYALLETIREYGAERLADSGDLDSVLGARTAWALDLVDRASTGLRGADQVAWSRRLDAAADDLLATLRHLVGDGRGDDAVRFTVPVALWWSALGRHAQTKEWVRVARSVPAPGAPAHADVVEVLHRALGMLEGQGTPAETSAQLAQLRDRLAGSRAGDHGPLTRVVSVFLDRFAGHEDDPFADQSETPEQAAQMAGLRTEIGSDRWLTSLLDVLRAAAAENAGNSADASAIAERAVAGFRAVGDSWGLAGSLRLLAQGKVYAGELDAAEAMYVEASTLTSRFGVADDDAFMLRLRLLEVRQRQGRDVETQAELQRMESLAVGGSAPTGTWLVLAQVNAALRDGRVEDARRTALARTRVLEGRAGQGVFGHERAALFAGLSRVHLAAGDPEAAHETLVEAVAAGIGTRDMPILSIVVVAAAHWAAVGEDPALGARWIGLAAALRGADDDSDPYVGEVLEFLTARIGAAAVREARAQGRGLDRTTALRELAAAFAVADRFQTRRL
jgi:predicted ATPase